MASRGSQYLFIFLLSYNLCFSPCVSAGKLEGIVFALSRRVLADSFQLKVTRHDEVNPPVTYPTNPVTNPANPVTNPVTTPNLVPPVVTVPAYPIGAATPTPVTTPTPLPPMVPAPVLVPPANPVNPVTPTAPVTNPVTGPTNPVTTPTNPVTTPTNPVTAPGQVPVTAPGQVPVTPPVTNPAPFPVTNAPATPGQSWCVAKSGVPDTALQSAIDYACGIGGADCTTIQQGASCYNPNTMQNHASVAFNSYYQKNPSPTSCDFGGTAMITNVNPSAGSCVFASSAQAAIPGAVTPSTASSSGTTPISFGAPPSLLNASNPASGTTTAGYGDSPPNSIASTSASNHFQPAISFISLMITTTIAWTIVFGNAEADFLTH